MLILKGPLKTKSIKFDHNINDLYINMLDQVVDKCHKTYHGTKKLKPIDVKSNKYIDFDVENDDKDLKPKDGDNVGISKYRNIFAKGYTLNWSEEIFFVEKVEIIYHGIVISMILMAKKLLGRLIKKCKTQVKQSFGFKK